ncbi:DUF3299 domain-containing protein [Thiolinea disciformis]|uniref:DUF3299 domain-containing protein n=1 Tax=Thiolinea disciformis TaxID=125614 RepID=UPI00037F1120|nr:DUF3299 domain-containing protein [Thiolinea disciformis]
MKTPVLLIVLAGLLMTACSDKSEQATQNTTPLAEQAVTAATVEQKPQSVSSAELVAKLETQQTTTDYEAISWESLELPGQGLADIMRKYQPMLDKIKDEDVEEGDKLMAKMQGELDAAPTNPAVYGKRIKLIGYVSPLEVDNQKGVVKEFLLVPYFGACIHVPPPPVNQTLLVHPQASAGISMEKIYEPVVVSGIIKGEAVKTNLAQAGYQISDALVEPYKEPSASQ